MSSLSGSGGLGAEATTDQGWRPIEDPALGVPVTVNRDGLPANRLVTIGDSITQGFMSAAIFRTDLSWPAIVAFELGLRLGTGFRYPTYEPPNGPGGLPLDLERLVRGLEARVGDRVDWYEAVRTLLWVRSYMDRIEHYWEDDRPDAVPGPAAPYHNLAVYGADLLDVLLLDADRIAQRIDKPPVDNLLRQVVDRDNDRAWRLVLESCCGPDRKAGTVFDAARAMGNEGFADGGEGPGIETLVVALGSNNALGTVLHLKACWTPDDYLQQTLLRRLESKGRYNVWQPAHFAEEWGRVVEQMASIKARHVIVATVPHVTIAPIARGCGAKVERGSPYFSFYTRPWINDADFDETQDKRLTEEDVRRIDLAIDDYNTTIVDSVRTARQEGRNWYVLDLAGRLDSLATRRYIEDPAARPTWWKPYELPAELKALDPIPNTRFFRSGPQGRTEGGLFSLDGVHPTTTGYGIIAREVIGIMRDCAGVPFFTQDGTERAPETVDVDFARVLASDSLISRPPRSISSTLALLGWLDETIEWVRRILPLV
jgi:lysophospholipase L1-like esterase